MIRVAVVGASGYTGIELLRWLQGHPKVTVTLLVAESNAGLDVQEVFPHVTSLFEHRLEKMNPDRVAEVADVAFLAMPAGLSSEWAGALLDRGVKVIDLGGDFRLPAETYRTWYRKSPPDATVQAEAVYGLTEWYAADVAKASFISNPGCYPTAALLGMLPLLKAGIVDPHSLIIDAKSGVSGAGRGVSLGLHYSEVNENFKAYKIGEHQHTPEIDLQLSRVAGVPIVTTFTTHLLPMTRGILATGYAQLKDSLATSDVLQLYKDMYEGHMFVRVREEGHFPQTKEVAHSNFCDIGLYVDQRTNRITVVSVIDNLVKGASGQAVQNLNVMMGWPESEGLWRAPAYL